MRGYPSRRVAARCALALLVAAACGCATIKRVAINKLGDSLADSGFTEYAYAFVQQDADTLEPENVERAAELRARARRLYLRGRDYGLRGLETRHRGFTLALVTDPKAAVRQA